MYQYWDIWPKTMWFRKDLHLIVVTFSQPTKNWMLSIKTLRYKYVMLCFSPCLTNNPDHKLIGGIIPPHQQGVVDDEVAWEEVCVAVYGGSEDGLTVRANVQRVVVDQLQKVLVQQNHLAAFLTRVHLHITVSQGTFEVKHLHEGDITAKDMTATLQASSTSRSVIKLQFCLCLFVATLVYSTEQWSHWQQSNLSHFASVEKVFHHEQVQFLLCVVLGVLVTDPVNTQNLRQCSRPLRHK